MKDKDKTLLKCYVCGYELGKDLTVFKKYHKGNICSNCSKEMFEDDIGYEP